jgi:hypothetical protein
MDCKLIPEEYLGKGGFAIVFQVKHPKYGKAALKLSEYR